MAFIYRASLGRNLTAAEGDANFTEAETRLAALESSRPGPDEIASVSLSGTQLSFFLASGTELGPVTVPLPRWRSRGEWLPFTIYAALDVITVEDVGLVVALLDHTSAATFDINAVNGSGDPLYELVVPAGVNLTFGGLADVTLTSIADNDFFAWDATAQLVTNRTKLQTLDILAETIADLPLADALSSSPPGTVAAGSLLVIAEPDGASPVGYLGRKISRSDLDFTLGSTSIALGGTVTTIAGLTLNSPTLVTPALGTPASGTLTNATGLPVSTGISGLGTGVATFLATPSSANLASAVTGGTGSGALVFGTSPTIATPIFSGTATGTYTLGGTPTLSGGTLTGATTLPGSGQISSGGDLLLGLSSAISMYGISNPGFQLLRSGFASLIKFANDTTGPVIALGKSRGSVATAAAVVSGDAVGDIAGVADDGVTNGAIPVRGAIQRIAVDATPSPGIVPMRFAWFTMPAAGSLIERLRIYSGGDVRQGSGTALATTATDGFFLISTCAGAPTGVPTNAGTGQIPLVFDKTNFQLYAYISGTGWKKSAVWT